MGHFVLLQSKKKARENDVNSFTSCYDVTSGHMTHVTSGHMTHATSGHVIHATSGHVTHATSGHVTDVTSGSTPFPNYDGLQVLKTIKY